MASISGSIFGFVSAYGEFLSGILPLSTYGTLSNSGFFSSLDLYTSGNLEFDANSNITLFLQGPTSDSVNSSIYLYTKGGYYYAESALDLFLCNSGASSVLNLFTKGLGSTNNAYVYEGGIPLYIERPEGAILNLFLKAQDSIGSGILDLFTQGAIMYSGSLDLFTSGSAIINGTLKLYSHGF